MNREDEANSSEIEYHKNSIKLLIAGSITEYLNKYIRKDELPFK